MIYKIIFHGVFHKFYGKLHEKLFKMDSFGQLLSRDWGIRDILEIIEKNNQTLEAGCSVRFCGCPGCPDTQFVKPCRV